MKKFMVSLICFSMIISLSVSASVSLSPSYIYEDEGFIYTFGNIIEEESTEEIGVSVNNYLFKLKDDALLKAKESGKFGIGLHDKINILGPSYEAVPYTKNGSVVTKGEGVLVDRPVRNIKYLGPVAEGVNTNLMFGKNFNKGTELYTNVGVLKADNIIKNITGLDYIKGMQYSAGITPENIKNAWMMSGVQDWISFDLYKSATIKVITIGSFKSLTEAKYGFKEETTTENNNCYLSLLNSDWPDAAQTKMDHMYTKHIDVTKEPVNVVLPNIGGWGASKRFGYITLIDYDEKTPVPEVTPQITNARYAGPNATNYPYKVSVGKSLKDGELMFTNNDNLGAKEIEPSLVGKQFITMESPNLSSFTVSDIKTAWGDKQIDWIKFSINKTATVKIITHGDAFAHGNLPGFTKKQSKTKYLKIWDKVGRYENGGDRNVMYEKTFEVPEGETVEVAIPNAPWLGTSKWAHIVVVDFQK